MAKSQLLQIATDFWTIRGSFKIGYLVDVGTHASLVRLSSGSFLLLDCYTLSGDTHRAIDRLTRGGEDLDRLVDFDRDTTGGN